MVLIIHYFKKRNRFGLERDLPGSHFAHNHQIPEGHGTYFYFLLTEQCLDSS